jgi:hypothetical protein
MRRPPGSSAAAIPDRPGPSPVVVGARDRQPGVQSCHRRRADACVMIAGRNCPTRVPQAARRVSPGPTDGRRRRRAGPRLRGRHVAEPGMRRLQGRRVTRNGVLKLSTTEECVRPRSASGAGLEQLPAWPQTLQRPGQHHPTGEGPQGPLGRTPARTLHCGYGPCLIVLRRRVFDVDTAVAFESHVEAGERCAGGIRVPSPRMQPSLTTAPAPMMASSPTTTPPVSSAPSSSSALGATCGSL